MQIIITMYIYHALINALSAHMIHTNLNMIFCTHLEHSPTQNKEKAHTVNDFFIEQATFKKTRTTRYHVTFSTAE